MKRIIISILLFLASVGSSLAEVYEYKVVRVIDGDTITIEAPFLPKELGQTLSLRIVGIDTPEKGYRAKCDKERTKAAHAKQFVENRIELAKEIRIVLIKWDKYGGRVLGDLIIDGEHLSTSLIMRNYAVIYNGSGKKKDWCA